MKSEAVEVSLKSRKFPKLMSNIKVSGDSCYLIILATGINEEERISGTVVHTGYDRKMRLGEFSDQWCAENFYDYIGNVTLSSEDG